MWYIISVHVCLEHLRWVEEHGPRDHVAVQRYLLSFSEFESFLSLEVPILGFACRFGGKMWHFCGFKQAQTYLDWQFGDSFLRKALEHIGATFGSTRCCAVAWFPNPVDEGKREPLDGRWWEVHFFHWGPVHVWKSAGCNWSNSFLFFISLIFHWFVHVSVGWYLPRR